MKIKEFLFEAQNQEMVETIKQWFGRLFLA